MCGIYVSAQFSTPQADAGFATVPPQLQRVNATRGPDAQNTHTLSLSAQPQASSSLEAVLSSTANSISRTLDVEFYASELRLRGDFPIVQPHVRDRNVLCWNGEIFEGIEISSHENDGSRLFDALCIAKTPEDIRDTLCTIEGPYAFAFYHGASQRLYFGRDPLGRRSLLISQPTAKHPYLLLSSVSTGANPSYDFVEVSTQHIYSLDIVSLRKSYDLSTGFSSSLDNITRLSAVPSASNQFDLPAKVNTTIPPEDIPPVESLDIVPEYLSEAVDHLISHLDRSVMLQVHDIPRFSLSEGKARLAILFSGGIDSTIITFLANKYIPIDEPIDLLNVAFENPRKLRIQKEGNIGGIPKYVRKAGGSKKISKPEEEKIPYSVPDRVTGIQEVEELRRICPGRTWNFVEVDVPYAECQAARPVVESLMYPGRTVMDLSLALALYFASRGRGHIRRTPESEPEPYISEARVLLNGLGSDELLGGYGRHRTVYNNGGWPATIAELQEEIDRIPTRNLGRDDRVISSHGKEARHPFLSLSLVSFLASLPVHFKLDPRAEVGFGDKMLLRYSARKLGLIEASSRKKRAMQFGSHSARMDGERRGDVELE